MVESVAENTVDAIVAPALWGAIWGAPGALGHRAVNTLDSKVGHHDERYEDYGWASAPLGGSNSYGGRSELRIAVPPGQHLATLDSALTRLEGGTER